jgi:DnaJ-class molecular chaperone
MVPAARPPAAAAKPPAPVAESAAPIASLDPQTVIAFEALAGALDDMDYFQILKLGQDAAPADIKKAFYGESRTYHPDRFYHLADKASKERVSSIYKRITEAYYVLRDDTKRKKYLADITGPERAQKLRFTEATEVEAKKAAKQEQESEYGTNPKSRQFFKTALDDMANERWSQAERNIKMAMTYEPANARYKEKLAEVQQKLHEQFKKSGDQFKIK